MTEKEVFNEITSELKWYIGYCSQGYATQLIQRYQDGRLSQKTIDKMFAHFGYAVGSPRKWVRVLDGKPSNLQTK